MAPSPSLPPFPFPPHATNSEKEKASPPPLLPLLVGGGCPVFYTIELDATLSLALLAFGSLHFCLSFLSSSSVARERFGLVVRVQYKIFDVCSFSLLSLATITQSSQIKREIIL